MLKKNVITIVMQSVPTELDLAWKLKTGQLKALNFIVPPIDYRRLIIESAKQKVVY